MEDFIDVNSEMVKASDKREPSQIKRRYIFLCEGRNTERFYFNALKSRKRELGIDPLVDFIVDHGSDSNSDARNLLGYSREQKKNAEMNFDEENDTMVLVFDGDRFEKKNRGYGKLIRDIEAEGVAAVSNPNFELFLLLHLDDAYETYIRGHEDEFLLDEDGGKDKSLNHAYNLLKENVDESERFDSKTDEEAVGRLACRVTVAIEQEKNINEDEKNIKGRVSCNVAKVIKTIIDEKPVYYR